MACLSMRLRTSLGNFSSRDPFVARDIRSLQIELRKRECVGVVSEWIGHASLASSLATTALGLLRPGVFSTSFSTTSNKDE